MFLGPTLILCPGVLGFARLRKSAFQIISRGRLTVIAQGVHKVSSRSKPLTTAMAGLLRSWSAARLPLSRWRLNKLAVSSFVLRLCLTAAIAWGAWRLISICLPLGAIRWGILIPAVASVTSVLFGGMLDFEAAVAQRAALSAKFTPDRWGSRAETVRTHAQEYVRTHGRRPEGMHVLEDIYTGTSFAVVYSLGDRSQ
jgi:hypothetical protein